MSVLLNVDLTFNVAYVAGPVCSPLLLWRAMHGTGVALGRVSTGLTPTCVCATDQDFIKAEPADAMKTPVRHLVMSTCANLMYPWLVPAMDPEIG